MRISIDGNISSGKTTLLSSLMHRCRLPIIMEPVHEWKEGLCLYYSDISRWSFAFNIEVLMSFERYRDFGNCTAIFERSPISCRYVFASLQEDEECMNNYEQKVLDKVYKSVSWEPDIIVYIQTTPEVCFERMKKRNRPSEECVDFDYICKVHDKYEKLRLICPKMIVVNGDQSSEEVYEQVLDILVNKLKVCE